jgi:hypothetical protein
MFAQRDLQIQLNLNGSTFNGGANQLTLKGLRAWATIQATTGGATPFFSQAQIRIEGMLGSDMAQLTTLGLTAGYYTPNIITVNAVSTQADGTQTSNLAFSGSIFEGYVDYNSQPDVGVVLQASATFASQISGIASSSYKGAVSVATMLQAICAAASPPLNFVNNGVTAVLSNHAVAGSAMDQIIDICLASLTNYRISNGTLYVWPQGQTSDSTIITLSPQTGMKGYPAYSAQGIDVEMEYNQQVELGRQMTVESSIPPPGPNAPTSISGVTPPGANGTFWIAGVTHELSSNVPGGPWFTKANLTIVNTQLRQS